MSRHLRILDFALASLLDNRAKTFAVTGVYALLVFLLASLLLFVGALRRESRLLLDTAPDLIVQRLRGGRHELIPVERARALGEIRGVGAVTPRVWGYFWDPPSGATFTFWGAESVPPGSLEVEDGDLAGDGDTRTCAVGQGVAEARFLWLGDRLPIRGQDGTLFAPRVVGIFTAASALLTHDLVVLPTEELRRVFAMPPELATDLAVEVTNPLEVETVARKIQRLWPDVRTVSRRQILQTWDAAFDWRGGVWIAALLSTLAAFAILVWDKASGLSAEEHRTLGILKAVGWTPRNVLELELWKGTVVSATAVLTGLLAAQVHLLFFDGALFARVLKGWSVLFPAFDLAPSLDAATLLPCVVLAVVPYVLASLVPAWRAAITEPDTLIRAVVLPFAAVLLSAALVACSPTPPQHLVVALRGEAVHLPLAEVADGEVHFFTFQHDGKNVNFLVRTDVQGALHAHLDACWSCYRYRRGFVVEGGDLVCIACRLAYPIEEEQWDFIGACAPIPIPFAVDGGDLILERAVLEKAARFF